MNIPCLRPAALACMLLGCTAPALATNGDYNDNGVVDAADYTIWRDNFGSSVSLPNDPTPGSVDQGDYDVWRSNFGGTEAPVTPGPGDPSLTVTPLGFTPNGNFEYRFDLLTNGLLGSLAIELAILAPVAQVQFQGFDIDHNVDAESLDGILGYEQEEDTWYNIIDWPIPNPGDNPFMSGVSIGYVDLGSGNPLFLSLGGFLTTQNTIEVLHLVVTAPSPPAANLALLATPVVGAWFGIIAQNGVAYSTNGIIMAPVPLPASLFLAIIPASLLLGCCRKARG